MHLERDPVKIAMRIVKSFNSSLKAFVFDKNLVDTRIVDRLIGLSGYDGILSRHAQGSIIVYYIDRRKLKRKCLYEKCIDEKPEERWKCINSCMLAEEDQVIRDFSKSVIDIAKNLNINNI